MEIKVITDLDIYKDYRRVRVKNIEDELAGHYIVLNVVDGNTKQYIDILCKKLNFTITKPQFGDRITDTILVQRDKYGYSFFKIKSKN